MVQDFRAVACCHTQSLSRSEDEFTFYWKLLSRYSHSGRSRAKRNRSIACGEQKSAVSVAGGLN